MCDEDIVSSPTQLLYRAIRLANRVAVIARAREIGICEGDAAVRTLAQDVARRGVAPRTEKETGLRIHVRVAPAIENDSRDIPARIEPARREHVPHLLAERALVLRRHFRIELKRRVQRLNDQLVSPDP